MHSDIRYYNSIYGKYYIMAKKDSKKRLFEVMERVVPDFKPEVKQNLQEIAPVTAQPTSGTQQTQQYSSELYKMIAPQLKMVNTMDKFAPAFKGWFEYLGYSPKEANIDIQRVRMDVEEVMKELGYK